MIDCPYPGSLRTPSGLPRLRQPQRSAIHWAAAALVLGLAACGGNNDDAPAAVADLAINAANAERVAGEALHSTLVAVNGFESQVEKNFVLDGVAAAARVKSRLLHKLPTGGGIQPQGVSSTSVPCLTSGKSTTTLSQATERKLTVGDFADVQFDACVLASFQFDGKAREVVTAVNATQTLFQAHGELTGFGSTDAGVSTLETGPYDLSFDRTNAANIKISVSSNQAVNVERRVNQRANAAYSFTALTRTIDANIATGASSINFSYTASGSFPVLGATRFQVTTPQALSVGLESGAATGTIKVTGAGGSTLLVTFLGTTDDSVRLDLDANGDGTIDQTQTRIANQLVQLVLAP